MRFMGLDLNLLAAFQILVEERSVSAAARRMHLSQSAMSAALGRLRESFDDELLVQTGNRMMLTPHAERLSSKVAEVLGLAEELIHLSTHFAPETAVRRFRISASDYITAVLLAPLTASLSRSAPGLMLEILPPNELPALSLERGDYDLLFTPEQYISRDHPARLIFPERHLVVGWDQNPVLAKPLTLEGFLSCGHVVVEFGPRRHPAFAESAVAHLELARRIEVIAPSFTAIPPMLVGTQRLALVHERLAHHFAKQLPLALREPPFEIPAMREMVQYHAVREKDPGLQWLLGQIAAQAEQ